MREFFKGWRRKAGSVVLLMGCVLAALCIRSTIFHDWVQFPSGAYLSVESVGTHIIVQRTWPGLPASRSLDWGYKLNEIDPEHTSYFNEDSGRTVTPYWAITMPLVIVSACLILWPQQKKDVKNCSVDCPQATQYRDGTIREFFKGWRRKMGCGLLVMALGSTAAWVVSYLGRSSTPVFVYDTLFVFQSADGGFCWQSWIGERNDEPGTTSWSYRYWTFAVPLSLLSAYLILWKPRKRA